MSRLNAYRSLTDLGSRQRSYTLSFLRGFPMAHRFLNAWFVLCFQASNGAPPELVRGSLTTAPSMQTVSTNLTGSLRSRPSAVASGAGSGMRPTPSPDTSRNPGGAPNRGSSARTTSRVPTEDRVPENRNSYDNPGLDLSSGSSSQDAGIRQNGPGPAPYTISYSKVIWNSHQQFLKHFQSVLGEKWVNLVSVVRLLAAAKVNHSIGRVVSVEPAY